MEYNCLFPLRWKGILDPNPTVHTLQEQQGGWVQVSKHLVVNSIRPGRCIKCAVFSTQKFIHIEKLNVIFHNSCGGVEMPTFFMCFNWKES
jgi:hypothetical protein